MCHGKKVGASEERWGCRVRDGAVRWSSGSRNSGMKGGGGFSGCCVLLRQLDPSGACDQSASPVSGAAGARLNLGTLSRGSPRSPDGIWTAVVS